MKTTKTGNVLRCEKCGAEVTVTKGCDCDDCGIVCCGQPMAQTKEKPKDGGCCCG